MSASDPGRVPPGAALDQLLADAWYAGRASAREIHPSRATGPDLRRLCARDVKNISTKSAEFRAALDAQPPQAPPWQPIETAPKDGTRVDLCAKCWLPAFDRFENQRFTNCWWMKDGEFGSRAHWVDLHKDWCPTHWMPIPQLPPVAEGRRAQEHPQ